MLGGLVDMVSLLMVGWDGHFVRWWGCSGVTLLGGEVEVVSPY